MIVPTSLTILLLLVAVGGSLLYGSSLALAIPAWSGFKSAAWLTLSAGFAWIVFVPLLKWISGEPLDICCALSLVTMAVGEVVLVAGALGNVIMWLTGVVHNAVGINAVVVALSNIAMAAFFAAHLRVRGVPVRRSLAVWLVGLNGSGAFFFAALFPWFYR